MALAHQAAGSQKVSPMPAPKKTWFGVLASGQFRYVAIWVALVVLLGVGAVFLPRSVQLGTLLAVLPFAAFLAMAAMGQAIVIMGRGIDLSVPAIMTLSSTTLLAVSGGHDEQMIPAVLAAVAAALVVGAINGVLVAVFRLNSLIVTLAVGSIVTGLTLWYRQSLPAEATVPPALADLGGSRFLELNSSVWLAAVLVVGLTVLLRKTIGGRRFEAVGANPVSANAIGLPVALYQWLSFVGASFLYAMAGLALSAFIRNPTLDVGAPYLLAPIAAAVLGATAVSGGLGSMVSVTGAAIFLTQLGQMLKLVGLETSFQMIIQGVAIALGMWLSLSSSRVAPAHCAVRCRPAASGRAR